MSRRGFKSALWAYECQSYFIGAIGGLGQWGYVLDPIGSLLTRTNEYRNPAICKINLDYCVVMYDKKNHIAVKKKYGNKIGISISPTIGAAMLTSETEEFSARDVAEEFGMKSFPDLITETRIIRNSLQMQAMQGYKNVQKERL